MRPQRRGKRRELQAMSDVAQAITRDSRDNPCVSCAAQRPLPPRVLRFLEASHRLWADKPEKVRHEALVATARLADRRANQGNSHGRCGAEQGHARHHSSEQIFPYDTVCRKWLPMSRTAPPGPRSATRRPSAPAKENRNGIEVLEVAPGAPMRGAFARAACRDGAEIGVSQSRATSGEIARIAGLEQQSVDAVVDQARQRADREAITGTAVAHCSAPTRPNGLEPDTRKYEHAGATVEGIKLSLLRVTTTGMSEGPWRSQTALVRDMPKG